MNALPGALYSADHELSVAPKGTTHGPRGRLVPDYDPSARRNPAAWIASVMAGICRQSENTRTGALGRATRQHSESHRLDHMMKDR